MASSSNMSMRREVSFGIVAKNLLVARSHDFTPESK
jgi:hypothetical protein